MNRDLARLLPAVFLVSGWFGACASQSSDDPNDPAAHCANAVKDQDEVDVDCGGAACKACVGAPCASSAECGSGACSLAGKCAAPGTRVCGVGFPQRCQLTEMCATGNDCVSTYCTTERKCAEVGKDPHSNGVKDEGETGVDCGGVIAMTSPCTAGQGCNTPDDCEAGCDTAAKLCQEPSHTDGKVSPSLGETDVDCGHPGSVCDPGLTCATEMNCEGLCTDLVCAEPTHNDMRVSPSIGETDVDCGGTTNDVNLLASPACVTDQACALDRDCEGLCSAAAPKKCLAPSNTDNKKNGDETDIDCGGTAQNRCVTGQQCSFANPARDCDSRVCLATGLCDQRRTSRKDGDESDIDCGGTGEMLVGDDGRWTGMSGTPARRCNDLSRPPETCASDSDCATGFCQVVDKVCVSGRSCRGTESSDGLGAATETAGLDTCGLKEIGDGAKEHESCCRTLPLPLLTTVKLDKYEITAGRMRQFIEFVKRTQGGVPNVRAWANNEVTTGTATGTRLTTGLRTTTGVTFYDFLPADMYGGVGLFWQLGGAAMDGRQPSGSQGCFNGYGSGGHATYWFPKTELEFFGATFPARPYARVQYDEKSLNCLTYFMAAAFCAWDGGVLPTEAQVRDAWGATIYPWGSAYATPSTATVPTPAIAGIPYETTINFANSAGRFFYHYPTYAVENPPGNGAGYYDLTGYIAAPGRFPLDRTLRQSSNLESWYDLAANNMEAIAMQPGAPGSTFCDQSAAGGGTPLAACNDGAKAGVSRGLVSNAKWIGGSWEGHGVNFSNFAFPLQTQYGKMGARCAR